MENQKISNSEDIDNPSVQSLDNDVDVHDDMSRFSRRKLLQVGIASSPLLLSVKSPVAWAGGGLEACTISALGSINTSNVNFEDCSNGALSPGYWQGVFKQTNSNKKGVYQQIVNRGAEASTGFNESFVTAPVFSYINASNSVNKDWNVSLSNMSPDYTFQEILKSGSNKKLSLYLTFTNQVDNRQVTVDVTIRVPNVHRFVVCGYLNTLFPVFIDYITQIELMNMFATALSQSSMNIIKELDSKTSYSGFVRNFSFDNSDLATLVSSAGLKRW